jgi:predicted DNA-binding protein (UPF0251 family)
VTGARPTAQQLREWSLDQLIAAGWCECGQRLVGHGPVPAPQPWDYGRPCARASTLGWGTTARGKPLPTEGGRPAAPSHTRTRATRVQLADRVLEAVRVVAEHGGQRKAAARAMGINTWTLQAALREARRQGLSVVAAPMGRRVTA